jgi:secreted trypsin-like serine protease
MKSKFMKSMIFVTLLSACAPSKNTSYDITGNLAGNIMGGQLVSPNEAILKTSVMINFKSYTSGAEIYCSGTVVAANYVLTAAHCFENREVLSIESSTGAKATALRFELHPKYNHSQEYDRYDIALVEFIPNENFKNIAQLAQSVPKTDEAVKIAGFGRTHIEDESQKVLNRITLKMASSQFTPSEAIINEDLTHGACFGDSGGPAYTLNGKNVVLWGVDSRTPRASQVRCGKFEIYTKVPAVLDWIQSNLAI